MGASVSGINVFAGIPPLPIHIVGRPFFVGNSSTPVPGGVTGVDSAGAYGDSPQRPFATLDYATGQCAANRGDVVIALPGHVEDVTAAAGLDLDVAGVTYIFLGNGSNKATIRFGTVVGADMDVDAADITLGVKGYDLGPRFLANIDALTGPIDVNAARFKMYGARWYDGTTINTTDCVVADANADNMVIDDFEFIDGNAAGTQKQSFIQVADATGITLRKIRATGAFATGVIENGTAWVDALLEDIVIDNSNAGPVVGILLQATSSGQARHCHVRVVSGVIAVTADNDMQWFDCWGVGVDAESAWPIGTEPYNVGVWPAAATAADGVALPAVVRRIDQTLIGTIANTGGTATIGAVLGDLANDSLVARLNDIGTNVDSTTTDNIQGKLGTDTELADRSLYDILNGGGPAAAAAAAAPANDVSVYAALRDIWDALRNGTGGAEPATNRGVMDYLGVSPTFYQPQLGYLVTKVGDISAAPDDLFTATGKCLVTLMHGEVTSVLATTQSLALVTSTNNQTIAAASTVTSDDVGTLYMVSGDPDLALNGGGTPGLDAALLTNGSVAPFIINDDRIYQSINGAGTGLIQWDLWYIPLEASASIASSA